MEKNNIIYFIEDAKDGGLIAVTHSYKNALSIQDKLLKNEGIDTYIR